MTSECPSLFVYIYVFYLVGSLAGRERRFLSPTLLINNNIFFTHEERYSFIYEEQIFFLYMKNNIFLHMKKEIFIYEEKYIFHRNNNIFFLHRKNNIFYYFIFLKER